MDRASAYIFVDDAHTFGGAQIALDHAIRALLDTNTGGSYLEPGRAINDQGADK